MRLLTLSLGLLLLGGAVCTTSAGDKADAPFNGTLDGWKFRGNEKKSKWKVGIAGVDEKSANKITLADGSGKDVAMINDNGPGGVDIYSAERWGDATIHVEVMVPKGSNSGIYVMGEYEIQVLDSFGRTKIGPGDMGGLYGASAPKVNASKKPGEWQQFIIEYQAPRYEAGKKVSNMKFLKITLNGQVIHENVEMKGPTPSGVTGKEAATGPIMFQGDHGPVAYRNIRVVGAQVK